MTPCVIKITTSDHFSFSNGEKSQVFFLEKKSQITRPLCLLTAVKRGVGTISVYKIDNPAQEHKVDEKEVTIHWFYGLNQGYKDFSVYIGGLILVLVGIAGYFKKNRLILKTNKKFSKKETPKIDNKNIIVSLPKTYFHDTLLNKNNEWRGKNNAIFYFNYYTRGLYENDLLYQIYKSSEQKFNEIISVYGESAIYFKIPFSTYDEKNSLITDPSQFLYLNDKLKDMLYPIFLHYSIDSGNSIRLSLIQDFSILNLQIKKPISDLKKEIIAYYKELEKKNTYSYL